MTGEPAPQSDIDPRFNQAHHGVCPNTGLMCTKLGDIRFAREAAAASFCMGFGEGDFDAMTPGQSDAFNTRQLTGIRESELIATAVAGPCLAACVLDGVDIRAYIDGQIEGSSDSQA